MTENIGKILAKQFNRWEVVCEEITALCRDTANAVNKSTSLDITPKIWEETHRELYSYAMFYLTRDMTRHMMETLRGG